MNTVESSLHRMMATVNKLNWPPISLNHGISGNSRIVHDLGIVGDDWDDFYAALRQEYEKDFSVPAKFMPSEVSHDSAMVAFAQGWISRRLPSVQNWYISKIRCSPLTLRELHELIVQF